MQRAQAAEILKFEGELLEKSSIKSGGVRAQRPGPGGVAILLIRPSRWFRGYLATSIAEVSPTQVPK